MNPRPRSLSTVLTGLLFAALLGGSAYTAFSSGNALVGALFSVVGLVVLAGSLRRPPREGPSLRRNVVWSVLGCLVIGAGLVTLAVLDDRPVRALAGLAGVIFLGLGVWVAFLLWKFRHIKEAASSTDPENGT